MFRSDQIRTRVLCSAQIMCHSVIRVYRNSYPAVWRMGTVYFAVLDKAVSMIDEHFRNEDESASRTPVDELLQRIDQIIPVSVMPYATLAKCQEHGGKGVQRSSLTILFGSAIETRASGTNRIGDRLVSSGRSILESGPLRA